MNIQIYLYWGKGTNTNTNIFRGQFFSNIQIFEYLCSSLFPTAVTPTPVAATTEQFWPYWSILNKIESYWDNLSKRGGKDGVFRGLVGLLQGISRGEARGKSLRSRPASPRKTPSFQTLLLRFTFYFQHGFSKY